MDANQPQRKELHTGSVTKPRFSPAWLYLGISLLLAMALWITVYRLVIQPEPIFAPLLLALIFLQALLTMTLEQSLAGSVLKPDWRDRLAFFGSLGLGFTFWLIMAFLSASPGFWIVLLVWLGSFSGGLVATFLNGRLWENNSPPSQQVQDEVYRLHRQLSAPLNCQSLFKRIFDISLALSGLVLAMPVWLICIFCLWIEDPGPVLFVKNSVGKGGRNFRQYKFRTMVQEAENVTGPVLSLEGDERVLLFGKLLRKTALDEFPQLINILKGEMSFVGPRPQRTILVHEYLKDHPEYAERHRVLPGLSGLAQIAGDYYLTPYQKLRLDRLYIRHASLGLDLKLLGLAFLITFWYRWKKGWNGRLPRRVIRFGARPNP